MPNSTNLFAVLAAPSTTSLVAVPKVSSSTSTKSAETGQTLNSSTLCWSEVDEFETVTKKQKKVSGSKPKQVEAPKTEHVTKIGFATKKRGGKRGGRKPKTTAIPAPTGPLPKIDFHKK